MNRRQPKRSGEEKSRMREVIGILLICLAVFFLVALVTYDPMDWPNSSRSYGQPTNNQAGWLGALVSHGFFVIFGYTSYALVALLLITAVVLFLHRSFWLIVRPAVILLVFGLFGPLLAALIMDTGSGNTLAVPAFGYGGITGGIAAGLMISSLGKVGAYLVSIAAMLVTVVFTTTIKPSSLVERIVARMRDRSGRQGQKRGNRARDAGEAGVGREDEGEEDLESEGDDDPFLTPVEEEAEEEPEVPPRPAVQPTIVNPRAESLRKKTGNAPLEFTVTDRSVEGFNSQTYVLPGPDLLDEPPADAPVETREEMIEKAQRIVECLKYFNIDSEVRQITPGPIVTRYELTLAPGVKVVRVVTLSDDLAMALKSRGGIRILAPIPGKAAIGIEVPNRTRSMVSLRDVVESESFATAGQPLILAIGKSTSGEPIAADLEKMPHLLIAGSTGSGKSVCINALIASILMKATPDKVKLIMVDPKVVELCIYNNIPHLLTPVITDPGRASDALKWAVREMEGRYRLLASLGVRDINQYNKKVQALLDNPAEQKKGEIPKLLPFIVIIIDEFADLMVVASNEIEESIARLAQMARAVGMHLVLATQRPSADVITGLIKANFPSRIAFKVMQAANSRIILDQNGADKLLGMGDRLFLQAGKPEPVRLHGAFISNEESQRLVDFVAQQGSEHREEITEQMFEAESAGEDNSLGMRDPNSRDSLFWEAARLVVRHNQGSVSLLQRRLKIGYARAARLIDQLELAGVVSPYDGSKAREVMVDDKYLDDMEAEGL
ncbi:MAG: DNA translocase FtsK [Candidatus Latescibacterota bacterium]